jgi:outer membrane protein assembly factor BamB
MMRAWVGLLAGASLCCGQAMFHGGAEHTGLYAGSAPHEFHRVKWKFATGDRVASSPVYADGAVYFGSDDGRMYAVNAANGVQRWMFATKGPVPSSPAVAGGLVYFASYDGNFYAVNEQNGHLQWKFATGGERRFEAKNLHGMLPKNQTMADAFDVYLSSPVAAEGAVYFGSGDGNIYALDALTGALRWKYGTGDVVHASPAYASGTIFVGSWDSYFYAIAAATGKLRWRYHGGEDAAIHNQVGFQSSPAVANGVVYTGCRDSKVYALDASTGEKKWEFGNQGSWVISTPAVVNGKVIFATSDSSLFHIVDAATGKSLVKQQGKAYVFSSPAVADGVVFLGILNGTLEARSLETGELLWDYRTDASKENRGWALTADRRFNQPLLYSSSWREKPIIGLTMQNEVGPFYSSPLIANGVVYIGSGDGYLYAIE